MSGGGHGGQGAKARHHEEEHEEHENHERWLVSYADMMTLLMVLFIVMFAISQVDANKFAAIKSGLAAGFGAPVTILQGGDALLDPGGAVAPDAVNLAGEARGETPSPKTDPMPSAEQVAAVVQATTRAAVSKEVDRLTEAQEQLQQALIEAGLKNGATFRIDERGLVVTIATDDVLFASGSAVLEPRGRKILDAIVPTMAGMPNRVSVDGHTDSVPIRTQRYPSNWELSTDRATGVLRYLAPKVPTARMSATGFADTRPLRTGRAATALTANRRVEIVLLATLDNAAGRALAQQANAPKHSKTGAEPDTSDSTDTSAGTDHANTSSATAERSSH